MVSAEPLAYRKYSVPSVVRTMPVVSANFSTGVSAPPSAGAGRVARIRVSPFLVTRATCRAAAKVTYAVPSGERAMFSGIWPFARSKCTAIRDGTASWGRLTVVAEAVPPVRAAVRAAVTTATVVMFLRMAVPRSP